MKTQVDFSRELILTHHRNGVKLLRPERYHQQTSLGELLKQKVCVFFRNTEHELIECNQTDLDYFGVVSKRDVLGNTLAKLCDHPTQIQALHHHNEIVMQSHNMRTFDEMIQTKDDAELSAISFKMPLYDADNKVMGILGIATLLKSNARICDTSDFTKTLNLFLSRDAFSTKSLPGKMIDEKYFTAREQAIIEHIILGKTMREIGLMYGRSTRTIEVHVANIKSKVDVKTRSQLIEKLRELCE